MPSVSSIAVYATWPMKEKECGKVSNFSFTNFMYYLLCLYCIMMHCYWYWY